TGAILISDRFGGSSDDLITSICASSNNDIIFGGYTDSEDFPATTGQLIPTDRFSGFIGRIENNGSPRIIRAFGGNADTTVSSVAVKGSETIAAGKTLGTVVPNLTGYDGFVAGFSDDLSSVTHEVIFGGSLFDEVTSMSITPGGLILVAGRTSSLDFPVVSDPVQNSFAGGQFDGFVAAVDLETQTVKSSSYLGSSSTDTVGAIAAGADGDLIVVGSTRYKSTMPQFPTSSGALQPQFAGGVNDAFITLISLTNAIPSNDNFAKRLPLAGSSVTTSANLNLASREPGEPLHAQQTGSNSLWWSWTAPRSGPVVITTGGSEPVDTVLGVYTNLSLATLKEVASNDDSAGLNSSWVTFHAQEGEIYQIAVDGKTNSRGPIELNLSMDIPPNDQFAHAQLLQSLPLLVTADNTNATVETGEPLPLSETYAGGNSVWFKWTAPENSKIRVDASQSRFAGGLTAFIYQGDSLAGLQPIADNNFNNLSSFVFSAVKNSTYYLRVDGNKPYPYDDANAFGQIIVTMTTASPPSNDDFKDRIDLTLLTLPIHVSSTLTDSSKEPGEPPGDYQFAGRTVWWTWTPAHDGVFTFKAKGIQDPDSGLFYPNSILQVFQGNTLASLNPLATSFRDYADPAPYSSSVTLRLKMGSPVQIRVDGFFYSAAKGTFKLDVIDEAPPENDDFVKAKLVSGSDVRLIGSTRGATRESLEPRDESIGATLWWKWTAPSNGSVILDGSESPLQQSVHKLTIDAFAGTDLANLTGIARNFEQPLAPDSCTYPCFDALASFRATAGSTYYIRLGGYGGAGGDVNVHLSLINSPPNDNFAESALLESKTQLTIVGNNYGGTREYSGLIGSEPSHMNQSYGFQSVWWNWPAPINGRVTLTLDETNVNHMLAIYRFDSGSSTLQRLVNNQPDPEVVHLTPQVSLVVASGQTYYFAVDTLNGPGAPYRIALEQTPVLQLTASSKPDSSGFIIRARGASTNNFVIEYSLNLEKWNSLSTNQLINGAVEVQDPSAGKDTARFYRAREIPE
ncbi:MAG: hypothetical protein JWM99_2261, partial [Verrucomicrobiales bacterium]|nr:hypothetical protein [Verrucomicrobiales bacterium]